LRRLSERSEAGEIVYQNVVSGSVIEALLNGGVKKHVAIEGSNIPTNTRYMDTSTANIPLHVVQTTFSEEASFR